MEAIFLLWILAELIFCIYAIVRVFRRKRGMLPEGRLYIAPAVLAAVIMGGVALAQTGIGMAQKSKAAKLARRNKRPDLEDNPYTEEAYNVTKSRLGQGLGDATKQAYLTNNDRSLASGIDGIFKAGGNANNIADLYDASNSGLRTMALANEEASFRNINNFLTQGVKGKADENRDKFFLNEMVPFQDRASMITGLSEQGMNNIWQGVNTGVQAYMSTVNPYGSTTNNSGQSPVDRRGSATVNASLITDPARNNIDVAGGAPPIGINTAGRTPAPSTIAAPTVATSPYFNAPSGTFSRARRPGPARWNPNTQRWE